MVAFVSLLKVVGSVMALLTGNATGALSIVVYQYKNVESNSAVIFAVGITCCGALPTEKWTQLDTVKRTSMSREEQCSVFSTSYALERNIEGLVAICIGRTEAVAW